MQNHYEILGVKRDTPLEWAYRSNVRRWTDANRELQAQIVCSYIQLSDPSRRRRYDVGLIATAAILKALLQYRRRSNR
jgi:hypothetical protein